MTEFSHILTSPFLILIISFYFFQHRRFDNLRAVAFEERLQGVALAALAALAQGEAVGPVSPATIRHDARRAIRRVRISKGGLKGFQCRNKANYRKCTGRF